MASFLSFYCGYSTQTLWECRCESVALQAFWYHEHTTGYQAKKKSLCGFLRSCVLPVPKKQTLNIYTKAPTQCILSLYLYYNKDVTFSYYCTWYLLLFCGQNTIFVVAIWDMQALAGQNRGKNCKPLKKNKSKFKSTSLSVLQYAQGINRIETSHDVQLK